MARILSLDG
uniref:Uncharacterized protein n=1 Tax=Arundo donax TaxID=35708 RepID=A0A0A8YNZ4_ARUDO